MDHRLRWLMLVTLLAVPASAQVRRDAPADHRFHTDRARTFSLPLPREDSAFTFAIFGDRTGGPAEGIEVLKQGVSDANLLDPDLVMTVGDLVQGYNARPEWLAQMHEFKSVMNGLKMPWFPVSGNHDIYWRGADKPVGEHESDFETHFGPLWYAFVHKDCWFVALHSDEGNPETGERTFNKPESQRMSPEQLAWLQDILAKAAGARHVFVFLHHPRWLEGGYGDDWKRVHESLVAAGNVRAVFAGHIHRMRYDGRRDGIEYFALATTGGHLSAEIPGAGYLHHLDLVTVRDEGITVSTLPIGTVIDPKTITGAVSDAAGVIQGRMLPVWTEPIRLAADLSSAAADCGFRLSNPVDRPVEVTVSLRAADPRWDFFPDHRHFVLGPEETRLVEFRATRSAGPLRSQGVPEVSLRVDYLAEGARIGFPERVAPAALVAPDLPAASGAPDRALQLDGKGDALVLADDRFVLADGPFTVEGWLNAKEFGERTAFINKTENSDYGIFVSGGKPEFIVHVGGVYRRAAVDAPLSVGEWHHLAGVFDGQEVRLYVDGSLVASERGAGSRTRSELPLVIGADPGRRGELSSFFRGAIDEVRLSGSVRYEGARFVPASRWQTDANTVLLMHLDDAVGPWTRDESRSKAHPTLVGDSRFDAR